MMYVQSDSKRGKTMSTPACSIIIPCYNEKNAIEKTVSDLQKALELLDHEIIVVDDGSTDGSRDILGKLSTRYPTLQTIFHPKNKGYGAALKTGIRRAATDIIVITDADGSYPHDRLPELIRAAYNTDMVVGARTAPEASYSFIRKIPKIFLENYCSWLAGEHIPDMNSGMRVFKKSLAEKYLNILPDGFSFTTTITLALFTNNYDVSYIPIGYNKRIGKSKIRPVRDTLNFLLLILRTGTYFAPLRVFLPIAGLLGFLFCVSLFYDIFVLSDLTDKSIMLLLFSMNTALFALLADMIDKRNG